MSGAAREFPLRILRVAHTLAPESGGPTESIRRSSEALRRLGHTVEIVTLDGPDAVAAVEGLTVHGLGRTGPARGYAASAGLVAWLREHRARFDAVLVHGLWQFQGWGTRTALRGTDTPWLVFPHGMLDPWFRQAYPWKHYKKLLYWLARERRVLNEAAAVCFTCEEERDLARKSFWPYKVKERVLSYGTEDPSGDVETQLNAWIQVCPELRGRSFLLYLGRIHSKKGIDLLIKAYAQSLVSRPDAPALVIAGPAEELSLMESLQRLATEWCPAGSVLWPGMLRGDVKWGALRACEAFCLTSHQENFGIAVAEALACGRPVLISRQVNIWREVIGDGAGLAADGTLKGANTLLSTWEAMSPKERAAMGQAARCCFEQRYEITQAAQSLAETVRQCLRSTSRTKAHR